ncbi:uncharacterized protein J3D65DRAFT_660220 [Phyllosticta citribraziliensis]|uniref:Uncharacterized protein n=1 Tax=Phyllosticta citribraziliensis TaxID=989973 RepID=A0ABR1LEY6_9PEZI
MPPKKEQKTERPVWQPGDGHGDPNPAVIEASKNKGAGHPTWKLFMGEVPAGVKADDLAKHVPRFCYLDDKAVWAVSKVPDLPKHDRCRFWPWDFTNGGGNISTCRRNRGRPAYNIKKKLASIPRSKGKPRYWFCGSGPLKAPIPESEPAVKEEVEHGRASTSEPSETADPSIESSAEPSTDAPQEKTPEDADLKEKSKKQASEEPEPKEPAQKMPTEQPGERHKEQPECKPKEQQKEQAAGSEEEKVDPDAYALVPLRRRTPLSESPFTAGFSSSSTNMESFPNYPSLSSGGSNNTTPFTDYPKAGSSSSPGSSKRSASPTGTSTPSKRQRSRLQSYILPPELKDRDNEVTLLQSRVNKLQARNAQLEDEKRGLSLHVVQVDTNMRKFGDALTNTRKERDAFRQAATALRTSILDKQDELAECHRYCVGLVERERELQKLVGENAALARKALKPLESMHRGLGQVLDDQEERFREAGLERVWEETMGEEDEQ